MPASTPSHTRTSVWWRGLLCSLFAAISITAWRPSVVSAQSSDFFSSERMDTLSAEDRRAWQHYVDQSERDAQLDRGVIESELDATGETHFEPAPAGRMSLLERWDDDAWFASDHARELANVIVTYQTPSGGWSKNINFRKDERDQGVSFSSGDGWSYIGTFDNDATTHELMFLARVFEVQGGDHYREAFEKGLRYTLRAQFPNGCWPQVYPLQGGYHDAATFNDEAIANVLQLLRLVARGDFAFVDEELRIRAAEAKTRGVACVLQTQIVVDGRPTVWAQQYDPIALTPTQARAYEHPSLAASESAHIVEFLMGIDEPSEPVVESVRSAVDWFEDVALYDLEYEHPHLREHEGGGPIWARFYEIGTNRPIFSNRDGMILYDWHELDDERRRGYAWYRSEPLDVLQRFEQWALRHTAGCGE